MRFALLSGTRSGSNVLCKCLDTNRQAKAHFEIFDSRQHILKNNYFGYAMRSGGVENLLPHKSQDLFFAYLDFIDSEYPGKTNVFDVKYFSTHFLNGLYYNLHAHPKFFNVLKSHFSGVVHLTRDNYLSICISQYVAAKRGLWHSAGEIENVRIKVDLDLLIYDIRNLLNNRARAERYLDEIGIPVLRVPYEKLFESMSGLFSFAMINQIADFIGVDKQFDLRPQLRPTTPMSHRQIVENYDEMSEAVARAGFAHFL